MIQERTTLTVSTLSLLLTLAQSPAIAEIQTFQAPHLGRNFGVWRLTHDPTVRDHANYHNTQCFSPDGRYVCYTHWADGGGKGSATVHLVDLLTGEDRLVDQGVFPRWAKHQNWLFFVSYKPRADSLTRNGSCVMWLDLETDALSMLVDGPEALGETDFRDRWLYGGLRNRQQQPQYREVRIPIRSGAKLELLPDVVGAQRLPNPRHPVYFTRRDHNDEPFNATRFWYDLDGTNQRIAVPTIQKCHMCWLGNGKYMLLGNGLIRGRRWNQPFPSNVDVLAAISVGDVSPCGTSGRFVCGDSQFADLRSGDGFRYIEPLSIICYPQTIGDNSGIYDADPKGSADGTKICFVSNYDLQNSPATHLVEDYRRNDDRLRVDSTEGFPESGYLNVHREVIGYTGKTATTFEGISRQALNTAAFSLRAGRAVARFDSRLLTDEQWKRSKSSTAMVKSIEDRNSLLMRQRQTDVYIAVVRKPDAPHLRSRNDVLEAIPGEHHEEMRGYYLFCDGNRISEELIQPGDQTRLERPGRYTAVVVEWSGLQSQHSLPVSIQASTDRILCQALPSIPSGFSWTEDHWVDREKKVKERVHLRDGVIRREWYVDGTLFRRHDLNEHGKAIRRLEFTDGQLAKREYYDAEGTRVSYESLGQDGYVIETIRYGGGVEVDHWWFEQGWPVKQVRNGSEYIKRGNRFGRVEGGRFIDLPRGALSE